MHTTPLFLALLLVGQVAETNSDRRSMLEDQYRAVSAAIVAEDLDVIVRTGYRCFAARPEDLRGTWKANFEMVAEYGPVEFKLVEVNKSGDEVIVVVDRKIFFRFDATSPLQFEQGRSRDRWARVAGRWLLVDRAEIGTRASGQILPDPELLSPRLRQLQQAVEEDDFHTVSSFWTDVAGKCPLVELLNDEPTQRLVTFLWRDDGATGQVEVRGGPFGSSRDSFERLPETDVLYKSLRLSSDSRYVYSLIVRKRVSQSDGKAAPDQVLAEFYPLDPLNPLTFNAGSVLELPDAPADSWHIAREGVAKGLVERYQIDSKELGETRSVRIYTSPHREASSKPTALAVFLDGEDCDNLMSLPTVLDNLVAQGRIPPLVALFVDSQGTRGRDLALHDPFVNFLADELVPWAAKRCDAQFRASRTVIGGMSLGGLTAAYAAHQRPDRFGNVLSQSGSFWRRRADRSALPEGWFPGELAKGSAPKVRFYLEVGRFESPGMVENNRRLRDVLIAKGCDVTYSEYHGGHDHVNWRVSVGNGLIALLGDEK